MFHLNQAKLSTLAVFRFACGESEFVLVTFISFSKQIRWRGGPCPEPPSAAMPPDQRTRAQGNRFLPIDARKIADFDFNASGNM